MNQERARPGTEGRDRMRSESRERFLREILTRIPADRIEEVYVFPAMRQGGVETGIAVIATTEPDVVDSLEVPQALNEQTEPEAEKGAEAPDDASGQATGLPGAAGEPVPGLLGDASLVESGIECAPADFEAMMERPARTTVYSARYRQTLKGVDRGSWEFELVAEADAPLVTVDAVVRGVHKRSGELADAERLTPEMIRAINDEPWRATTG